MPRRRFVVISYDISDDKRRDKVFKCLKRFGQHVQYSVFECDITEKDYVRLRYLLEKIIRREEGDHIRFYFLCNDCREKVERLGGPKPWIEEEGFVV